MILYFIVGFIAGVAGTLMFGHWVNKRSEELKAEVERMKNQNEV